MRTLLCVLTLTGVASAHAQMPQVCFPRDELVSFLTGKAQGESVRLRGTTRGGKQLFEAYVNEATGTYTLVITDTNNTSCMVGAGRDSQMMDAVPSSDDSM